jgi:GNAT superfamily N-acetyltransferase
VEDVRLELAEAAAYEALNAAGGLPHARIAGAVCIAMPQAPENTMVNRVTGLGLGARVRDADLDEVDAFFRGIGVHYAVALSPFAPPDLGERLRVRGFTTGYAWMKFARGIDEPPRAATALRVEEVSDGEDFGRIVAGAYGMPPELGQTVFASLPNRPGFHCFVAFDAGEPAAAAALHTDGRVGWLGVAGTLPEHRGKGGQTALLAARIAKARELGIERLTTETGERVPARPSNSYRNILRAGFSERYVRANLLAPP